MTTPFDPDEPLFVMSCRVYDTTDPIPLQPRSIMEQHNQPNLIKRVWRRFVAFWIGDDPNPELSQLDRWDGLK
jgi:hypothetical protein